MRKYKITYLNVYDENLKTSLTINLTSFNDLSSTLSNMGIFENQVLKIERIFDSLSIMND